MAIEINAGNNCGKHSATSLVHSGCTKNSHNVSKILFSSNLSHSFKRKMNKTLVLRSSSYDSFRYYTRVLRIADDIVNLIY